MTDINDNQSASADGQDAGAQVQDHVQDQDPNSQLETDLRKLNEERNILFEQLARVQADFRNAQKRLEADKQQAIQFANARLLQSLLPVIDNFERALNAGNQANADPASLLKGMQIVYDQLMSVLKQQNVEVIAPQPGTPFDPNQHQALMQQPGDRYQEPTVTQLLAPGYAVQGRVLRPAQVAVSKIG